MKTDEKSAAVSKPLPRTDLLKLKETQLEQALTRVEELETEVWKYKMACRRAVDRFREQMLDLMDENARLRLEKVEAEVPADDGGGVGDAGDADALEDLPEEAEELLGDPDPAENRPEDPGPEDPIED